MFGLFDGGDMGKSEMEAEIKQLNKELLELRERVGKLERDSYRRIGDMSITALSWGMPDSRPKIGVMEMLDLLCQHLKVDISHNEGVKPYFSLEPVKKGKKS